MLVLSRNVGETVELWADVQQLLALIAQGHPGGKIQLGEVQLVRTRHGKAGLGFRCPPEIIISRPEVLPQAREAVPA